MKLVRYYALAFVVLALIYPHTYAKKEVIAIKLSHAHDDDSPKGLGVNRFKELAEKFTNDRVRIDIYPEAQQYNDNIAIEAVQLGAIHMAVPSFSKIAALGLYELEVFDLPYLFPNDGAVHRVTQGPIGQKLLSKLETKGIVGLGIWDNGFKSLFTNKLVHTPDDMEGLKIRIDQSGVLASQMKALGAMPMIMSFPALIASLRRNVLDGAETTPANLFSPEVIWLPKYVTVTNHGYLGYGVIINKRFWDSLPTDIAEQLRRAVNETTPYTNTVAKNRNDAALTMLQKSRNVTVHTLNDDELALWKKALQPISQQVENRVGKALIDEVRRTVKGS